MWLPMWVFDGNGFTMACLAVWIRNVALRWDLPQMTIRQERWMRRHPTAPVNLARISVATSGTDFTAPEADFPPAGAGKFRQRPADRSRFPHRRNFHSNDDSFRRSGGRKACPQA